jgi:hypothetical protein
VIEHASVSPRPPSQWTRAELRADAATARKLFVAQRRAALAAERKIYDDALAEAVAAIDALLRASNDLLALAGNSLTDRSVLNIARYLTVPPISLDDLDTLTDSCFGNWVKQTTDRGMRPTASEFTAAARLIGSTLDGDRAPWLAAGHKPTNAERLTFLNWNASVRATSAVLTARRSAASERQEGAIRAAAAASPANYAEVTPPGTLSDPIKQMQPGSYASSSRRLNRTTMDVPIRLRANHPTGLLFLAIEAKVSNSSINSRKRLLEVTRKREIWDNAGTLYSFRTAAVLAGVFDVERLIEAQDAGVLLFWEHRLTDLTSYTA